MEVGHNEKSEANTNNTEEFDAIEAADATGKAVGDFLMENDYGCAGSGDNHP